MSSNPNALTRTSIALLLAAIPFAGCDAGGGPLVSEQPRSTPSAASPVMPSEAHPPPPPARNNCRWQGYGIGLLHEKQCNTTHLFAHSAGQCLNFGGEFSETRNVAGGCAAEAEEVQVFCCFKDGAPPMAPVTRFTGTRELDRRVSPASGSSTRAELTARAEQACAKDGTHLGDWSAWYAPDGVSAEILDFYCL